MELNKENVKKIIGIVTFAILLSWGLKNTEILGTLFRLTVGLIMPFLIGGALAFVINVPMRFVERKLFDEPYRKKNAAKKKASNGLSDEAAFELVNFADSGNWSCVYRHVPDCSGDCQQHYHNCQQCQGISADTASVEFGIDELDAAGSSLAGKYPV